MIERGKREREEYKRVTYLRKMRRKGGKKEEENGEGRRKRGIR